MITVQQAQSIIQKNLPSFASQMIPLREGFGRVLAEDVRADRDQPAFHKSLMDGIAVNFDAWKKGQREFMIEGIQPAGKPARRLRSKTGCTEIMTGGVLTEGCDCVIPVEYISIKGKRAAVQSALKLHRWQNIRLKGGDHKKGSVVLWAGTRLSSLPLSIAASVGKLRLKVKVKPKVAVISTGDEIVAIEKKVQPFEVRQSNSFFIQSVLDNTQLFASRVFHLKDEPRSMFVKIKALLKEYDCLVLSGGVSMGKFDYVPRVLKSCGIKVLFHKVQQKPGKPFWFGTSAKGQTVFALPGNPVSTFVTMHRYVLPNLKLALGLKEPFFEMARLERPCHLKTDLTVFLPVKVKNREDGHKGVSAVSFKGSGDLGSLGSTDGFVELPGRQKTYPRNSLVKFFQWSHD